MLFPSPSGCFYATILRQKYKEEHCRARSLKSEAEIIEQIYGSRSKAHGKLGWGWGFKPCQLMLADEEDDMKVDSKLGWEFNPCNAIVADDDNYMKIDLLPAEKPATKKVKKVKKLKSGFRRYLSINGRTTHLVRFQRVMMVDLPCENQTTKKGKKLNGGFHRFLSNNGRTDHLVRFQKGCHGEVEKVDFDSLTGKHLIICCFEVPMFSDIEVANECRALIETYEQYQSPPFEIVVVVKMRTDHTAAYDQKAAFNHFCSAFPSCLAVPFSDVETRDYICSCFSSNIRLKLDSAILVDPNGLILGAQGTLDNLFYYGSEWSPPFLASTLKAIDQQDDVLRCSFDPIYASRYSDDFDNNKDRINLSLYRDILLCSPNRTLHRFESDDEHTAASSTVLELSNKYVGLYLCFDGRLIQKIKAAHDHCLANKQQLEIVLVCMSLFEEPDAYYQHLYQTLRLFNVKSWFLFDYDSTVCRRLWRVFGSAKLYPGEKLIIVPPNCESGELCGREVITHIGITEYPFTRSAILKRRLEHLRSLTPLHSSLFRTGLFQKGEEYDSEQLRGKNLILYVDGVESNPSIYYNLLMKHYPKMKAMGWEVVFVPMVTYMKSYFSTERGKWDVEEYCYRLGSNVSHMPWPVMSTDAAAQLSVKEKLAYPIEDAISRLYAVRKDGNIVSRIVEERLETDGVTESLFDDLLESDLAFELATIPMIDETETLF